MKKKWFILVLGIACLGIIFGVVSKGLAVDKPTIAVVLKDSNSEYWKTLEVGAKSALKNFGANGKVYILGKSNKEQIDLFKQLLKEKPDALITYPGNSGISVPILKEYKQKHIPVLLIDTEADWQGQTSFMGTDNVSLGKKAGELLSSMLQPEDKVALIGEQDHSSISDERFYGVKQALAAAGISVVAEKKVANNQAGIQEVLTRMFQDYPDLKGVFTVNDDLAVQVIQNSKKAGLALNVIGADGTTKLLKYIQAGDIKATIAQNPYDIGFLSVDHALKAIDGITVEKKINSGVDIIDTDNVDDKLNFLKGILNE